MATLTQTTITAAEIQMGIEHYTLVIAEWDAACEDETIATDADVAEAQQRVAEMFEEINAMTAKEVAKPVERKMSSIEASMPAWMLTGRTTNGTFSGRGTEPAAQKAAEPAEVAQAVDVMIEQVDSELASATKQTGPTLLLDNEEQREFFEQWNARAEECHKQQQEWEDTQAERCAIQTEPDEQDTLIAELAFESDAQPDRERYFAARSDKYVLLHQRADGLAVNCSCPSRTKKLRFQGIACKHMKAHNAMLAPAKNATQAA